MAGSSGSFLARAHYVPLVGGALYVAFVCALMTRSFQAHNLYLHKIQFPFNAKFSQPERYGLAPQKTRNLRFTTSDGVEIGAWHVLPDVYHRKVFPSFDAAPLSDDAYDEALRDYPTVIYLHGNAANRAAPFRIASYNQFTARTSANVIAIDYRGFGDSQGEPTEDGLALDAKAAWDWLMERKAAIGVPEAERTRNVLVVGQSLGTGVAVALTDILVKSGTPPEAMFLIAPYISIAHLITSYRIGGLVQIFAPLKLFPNHQNLIPKFLYSQFANFKVVPHLIRASGLSVEGAVTPAAAETTAARQGHPHIIISHADDDDVIPCAHGEALFDGALRAHLGLATAPTSRGTAPLDEKAWLKARNASVSITPAMSRDGAWAQVHSFSTGSGASVSLIRTPHGGHNGVGDGVVDIVGQLSGIAGPVCP
ncbi:alpha/beta-hydrolase [Tilletiopsis washingtonensis]|uniref:Alpha/beta-hydrolase n=1 Tax=Tilletiopsis washingtonensis TaxID=58919 RepID=A0A316ZG63_9BASI|nr:alpha/beta-hydrolase [Tilletiopsis washingtonensis]PWO00748.1 alpha/beta-hydrolase [Tilletiopsis washingtonensis]